MPSAIVPVPKIDVTVRDATPADVPFIDGLQKTHARAVGFMRTSWIEAKIRAGQVIVAEDASGQPVGYCMGVDRYFKRDDVGIIHQLNVAPGHQRGFVGATLLKAMFDRAAYGCRLFC
jgi:N-acetylglutamate synthase-like GNAT family acetyltransferase